MTLWRALTVKQPWVFGICYGGKRVENRTWPIPPKHLEQSKIHDQCGHPFKTDDSGDFICDLCCELYPSTFFPRFEPFRVMLHAGQQWDKDAEPPMIAEANEWIGWRDVTRASGRLVKGTVDSWATHTWQPFGAVVAVMTLTGSHATSWQADECQDHTAGCWDGSEWHDGPCSPWAQFALPVHKPMHHWGIGDVTVLDTPVPAKGKLGLWVPDGELIDAVEAQL